VTGAKEQNKYQSRHHRRYGKRQINNRNQYVFPLNLNFAIAQAAARPNMVLIGTVIAMVMRVSFMPLVLSDR